MNNKFGERLRELRKQQKVSQRDLAEMIGVDFSYISKIETGDMPPPSATAIHRLALVLCADESELIILAGKVPIDAYRIMLQRAYRLLEDINLPFKPVGKDDIQKWLEDAKPLIEGK